MKFPPIKHLALAATLGTVALSGIAVAKPQTEPAPAPGQPPQRMKMPTTREEATARADQQFAKLDANHDGQITQAEMTAAREARRGPGGVGKRGGRMGERMFARMDTDRSGSISQAEFRAAALERFQRIDTNGDGRIDATEAQAVRDRRMARGQRGGGDQPTGE